MITFELSRRTLAEFFVKRVSGPLREHTTRVFPASRVYLECSSKNMATNEDKYQQTVQSLHNCHGEYRGSTPDSLTFQTPLDLSAYYNRNFDYER